MIQFLYTLSPQFNWEGLMFILLFVIGAFLYSWGVATGEERAEQKMKQEQQNRYRW